MNIIETQDLKKSYGPLEVIRGITLSVPSGEWLALTGPSGSGKSTLLSLMAGLDRPDGGTLRVLGERIDPMDEERLALFRRKHFGFVFQAYHLIPELSAAENAALPLELSGQSGSAARVKALELLERVGLKDRGHHRPRELSGGEQQRVALVRALIHEPEILFADEPTGSLDSKNSAAVLALLKELRGQATLVLVTHDATIAAQASRQITLKDGRLA